MGTVLEEYIYIQIKNKIERMAEETGIGVDLILFLFCVALDENIEKIIDP